MISYSASGIFKEALGEKKNIFSYMLTLFSQIVSHAKHANANEVSPVNFLFGDVCRIMIVWCFFKLSLSYI